VRQAEPVAKASQGLIPQPFLIRESICKERCCKSVEECTKGKGECQVRFSEAFGPRGTDETGSLFLTFTEIVYTVTTGGHRPAEPISPQCDRRSMLVLWISFFAKLLLENRALGTNSTHALPSSFLLPTFFIPFQGVYRDGRNFWTERLFDRYVIESPVFPPVIFTYSGE